MNHNNSVWRTLALVTQLGISMLTPVFLCVFVGWLLERKFGWNLMLLFIALGFVSGIRNAYLLAKNAVRDSDQPGLGINLKKEKSQDEKD